jgi:hypothetical protein
MNHATPYRYTKRPCTKLHERVVTLRRQLMTPSILVQASTA